MREMKRRKEKKKKPFTHLLIIWNSHELVIHMYLSEFAFNAMRLSHKIKRKMKEEEEEEKKSSVHSLKLRNDIFQHKTIELDLCIKCPTKRCLIS